MANRRLLLFLAGALAVGMSAAWMVSDSRPVRMPPIELQSEVCYAVELEAGRTDLDLRFEENTQYRLIISNLNSLAAESVLTISGEEVAAVERSPLRKLTPLQSAFPRGLPAEQTHRPKSEPVVADAADSPSRERAFFLHVTDGALDDPKQYAKVRARIVGEGIFARVYLDENFHPGQLARGLVPEIVRLFDEEIVPNSRRFLGEFRDVDGDGKFAILITPWLTRLQGGKTSLGGFVRGSDFQTSIKAPFGNRADLMYLSTSLSPGPHLHSLLAHEFAHAVCFSERLPTKRHPQGLPTEEDWLNEAIAHVSESLHEVGWTNLDHRVSQFLDATHQSPLVVANYYADGLWRDPGCRGATFLFLRFVVDQFGDDVLKRLIASPDRGVKNLEAATGVSFAELFRRWTIAIAAVNLKIHSPGYRSLDLNQPLGRWGLQGAKPDTWNLGSARHRIHMRGTTFRILDVQSNSPGTYRIKLRSQDLPRWQVTVIRLSKKESALQAAATWQASESGARSESFLKVEKSLAVKVLRCSVECRQDKHRQSVCFLPEHFSERMQTANQAGELLTLKIPSRMFPRNPGSNADWQLKILAEDKRGRRIATWLPLPAPAVLNSRPPLAVNTEAVVR